MWTLLLLIAILSIAFCVPACNRSWGYYPSGGLGVLLLALVLFMFLRPI